ADGSVVVFVLRIPRPLCTGRNHEHYFVAAHLSLAHQDPVFTGFHLPALVVSVGNRPSQFTINQRVPLHSRRESSPVGLSTSTICGGYEHVLRGIKLPAQSR